MRYKTKANVIKLDINIVTEAQDSSCLLVIKAKKRK